MIRAEEHTQKSAEDALGRGSVPARALRANMNMNSREDGGWWSSTTPGNLDKSRCRNSMLACAISGSLPGSMCVSRKHDKDRDNYLRGSEGFVIPNSIDFRGSLGYQESIYEL